jgi:hypothetical protein
MTIAQTVGKKYIPASSSGWINAKIEPSGMEQSLPEFLQVQHTETKTVTLAGKTQIRDYFTISEGVHRGKRASIMHTNGRSNLSTTVPAYRGPMMLKFDAQKQRIYHGSTEVAAITQPRNPIRNGTHFIRLPDFPHPKGSRYLVESKKALTWFYIGPGTVAVPGVSDFYLHTGMASDGCVTVTDIRAWDNIYQQLILSRQGDMLSVGTIKVINSTR